MERALAPRSSSPRHRFDAVIHFAGLKAVGESVSQPLMYYENNIGGTINLLNVMGRAGCKNIVFSSSATVLRPATRAAANPRSRP